MEGITVKIDRELEVLVPRFLGNCRKSVEDMRRSIAQSDLDAVRRIGHSLKGVGGGYGFARITELGAAIEQAAKAGVVPEASESIEALGEYLEKVQVEYT